jgi:hypothetical protein
MEEYECMRNGSGVAGGAGEIILRKTYGDGGVRDVCGGGAAVSTVWGELHHVLWYFSVANWRSIQREGFRTTVELLERGCILPAAWRRRKAICQVGLLTKQICGKAKKEGRGRTGEGAPRQRRYD